MQEGRAAVQTERTASRCAHVAAVQNVHLQQLSRTSVYAPLHAGLTQLGNNVRTAYFIFIFVANKHVSFCALPQYFVLLLFYFL